MADFVAVLRKTLDGLGEATPELRGRVYDKARATVSAKLAAINPPPPAAVADRQKKALEDAITSVESEYAPAKPTFEDPLEELESVFAALKEGKPLAPARPPLMSGPAKPPLPEAPRVERSLEPARKPEPATRPEPQLAFEPVSRPVSSAAIEPMDDEASPFSNDDASYDQYEAPARRRNYGGLIAAAVAAIVVAGAGYGVWLNKDEFGQMLGLNGTPAATPSTPQPATSPAAGETDVAAAPPADTAQPNSQQAPEEEPKFTQRLNADGTEVDAGAAGGEQTFGEGTSVASLTTPVAADQPLAPPPAGATPPATDPAVPPSAGTATAPPGDGALPPVDGTTPAEPQPAGATPADAATPPVDPAAPPPANASGQTAAVQPAPEQLAVGQRAIFYEERTNVAQGSAEPGSIVWTEIQESPGGDAPAEPAIRAEATIPGKDIQLRMTIRRNSDKTLPASHIIEMIFLTPDNFEGGGIDNVLRIALKNSEQDAGSPLIGIPAKIADGFFLIALNDSKNEIDANMNLLKRQNWIDIPIVYKNGRRALFTMEKGVPGEKVFEDTLKAWEPKTAG